MPSQHPQIHELHTLASSSKQRSEHLTSPANQQIHISAHNHNASEDGDDEDQIFALPEHTDALIAQARERAHDAGSMFQDHHPQVRKLGIFSTSCLIMNRMIGTGIFETPARVWKGSGSPAAALLMWTLGSLTAFSGLAVYMELGLTIPRYLVNGQWRSVPRSGGEKNYLEYLFKKPKFLATCVYAVIFIFLGNTAGNAIVFSNYFLQILGYSSDSSTSRSWTIKGISLAVITIACLLHGSWRSGGIWTNNTFAVVKVGILWFFIISGLYTYSGNVSRVDQPGKSLEVDESFRAHAEYLSGFGVHGWMSVLLDVSFSFGGFENAHYVLSEVKKPMKKLRYSAFGALGLVSLSYILTNVAYFTVITAEDMSPDNLKNRTISMIFFEKVFSGNQKAQQALPALVAISAFGNIINATFVSAKVKQEIAKEGVLPFSDFWRSEYVSPFSRFRNRRSRHPAPSNFAAPNPHHNPAIHSSPSHYHRRVHSFGELTPMPALFLHWITSLILILAPPSGDEYTIFTGLYAYMTLAWFGIFLAGGLLYVGYWKPFKFHRRALHATTTSAAVDHTTATGTNPRNTTTTGTASSASSPPIPTYRWRSIANFTPPLGPLLPIIYLLSCLTIVLGRWIPEPSPAKNMSSTGIAWYVIPTIGVGLFFVGVGYWAGLTYVLPFFWNKRLRVRRTPYLDRELNFRFEEVETRWLDEGASEDEVEGDPDLQG